jgi:two-component sensor histidine kinase
LHATRGFTHLLHVPLTDTRGTFGTLNIGRSSSIPLSSEQIDWAEQVGLVISANLSAQEARDALDAVNANLEERIVERTAALNSSLREKETLLREIHHRVKNNLQIISSLLTMQARRIDDPTTRSTYQEAVQRVRSIAMLHEHLYGIGMFTGVELSIYLREVANFLRGGIAPGTELELVMEPIRVGIETAVPFGLIVTELITNALKYGRPVHSSDDTTPPRVRLELRQSPDGNEILMTVEDNGPGLPDDFDLKAPFSLGMTLIVSLTRQLRGSVRAHHGPGARLEFSIPSDAPDSAPA